MANEPIDWLGLSRQWAEYRGWKIDGVWWTHPEKGMARLDSEPEFDRSVDDLLESLPQGWFAEMAQVNQPEGKWEASVTIEKSNPRGFITQHSQLFKWADTCARALLLALLATEDVKEAENGR